MIERQSLTMVVVNQNEEEYNPIRQKSGLSVPLYVHETGTKEKGETFWHVIEVQSADIAEERI